VIAEYKINDLYKIEVSRGGFLACGDILKITKSELWIFDKGIYRESSLCLRGINKIETVDFHYNHAEFLIFHNGEWDSENPFRYEIENKNIW
jgi:ABC-2 type transport system permease protein